MLLLLHDPLQQQQQQYCHDRVSQDLAGSLVLLLLLVLAQRQLRLCHS